MALDDDDMTTPPQEPDSGTPADRAAGSIDKDEYLGRDGGADGGADSGAGDGAAGDGGADGGAGDGGADGGAGGDDPTTETEEDTRFA